MASDRFSTIMAAIQDILVRKQCELSFEELYENAYLTVIQRNADQLYHGVQIMVGTYLREKTGGVMFHSGGSNLLEIVYTSWQELRDSMDMISELLMYLEEKYAVPNELDCIFDLGMNVFRDLVIKSECIGNQLQATLLSLIMKDREGKLTFGEHLAIKQTCSMLISLGSEVFQDVFEAKFLEETFQFYINQSKKFLLEGIPSYISKVETCIAEEEERADAFLHSSTKSKLIQVTEEALIQHHMETLVKTENNGVSWMLENNKVVELNSIYTLLNRVQDGHRVLAEEVVRYLTDAGQELVTPSTADRSQRINDLTFIQNFLHLMDRLELFLEGSFNRDKYFDQMITGAVERVLSQYPRSNKCLSVYIDDKLKSGGLSDAELEDVLERSMVILRILQTDEFKKEYKNHLAARLLNKTSTSADAEKLMICKLKSECGSLYTQDLERMINDVMVSKTTNRDFKRHMKKSGKSLDGVDICVQILTSGIWPGRRIPDRITIPRIPYQAFEEFRNFYLSKTRNRILTLNPFSGTAEVTIVLCGEERREEEDMEVDEPYRPPKKYNLVVNTIQMVILLSFNTSDSLTYQEIKQETFIPEPELTRALLSLSEMKPNQRILHRTSESRNISPSDTFTVNEGFSSSSSRVKFDQAQVWPGETESGRREARKKVEKDRKHEIEACIVRIMKSNKQMYHDALMSQVVEQLNRRFNPSPTEIRKRIELLIDRDYIERSTEDRNIYIYIA